MVGARCRGASGGRRRGWHLLALVSRGQGGSFDSWRELSRTSEPSPGQARSASLLHLWVASRRTRWNLDATARRLVGAGHGRRRRRHRCAQVPTVSTASDGPFRIWPCESSWRSRPKGECRGRSRVAPNRIRQPRDVRGSRPRRGALSPDDRRVPHPSRLVDRLDSNRSGRERRAARAGDDRQRRRNAPRAP